MADSQLYKVLADIITAPGGWVFPWLATVALLLVIWRLMDRCGSWVIRQTRTPYERSPEQEASDAHLIALYWPTGFHGRERRRRQA